MNKMFISYIIICAIIELLILLRESKNNGYNDIAEYLHSIVDTSGVVDFKNIETIRKLINNAMALYCFIITISWIVVPLYIYIKIKIYINDTNTKN